MKIGSREISVYENENLNARAFKLVQNPIIYSNIIVTMATVKGTQKGLLMDYTSHN